MVITVLQFELIIPHSESLKDKRRVVKSLKDRLHREHMVCVAELAALDNIRTAVMGVACLSSSAPYASEVLDRIMEKLKGLHDARLGEVTRKTIHPSTAAEDDELAGGADPVGEVWTPGQQNEIARSLGLEIEEEEDCRP
jgi:uncharacterized protein YlxP (DUF503 family)